MARASRILGIFGSALLLACGARTGMGDDMDGAVNDVQAAPDAPAWSAVVINDCGPADGPAYVLRMAPTPPSCNVTISPVDFDQVAVWTSLPATPSTLVVNGRNGQAQRCRSRACTSAASATLTFTAITATTVSGTYRLDFTGSPSATGSFVATRCNNPAFCG